MILFRSLTTNSSLLAFLLLLTGCTAPAPQNTVSVKPIAVPKRQLQSQSVITQPAPVTEVPQDVKLEWNPSPDTENEVVSGYNIHYGIQSGTYDNIIPAGDFTNATALGLLGGVTYYFAATAVDDQGVESDFSPELAYAPPLVMDLRFAFDHPVTNVVLQASPDLIHWQDLGTIPTNGTWRVKVDTNRPVNFYRSEGTLTP